MTAPVDATELRIMILVHEMAGWLTVDDVALQQGTTPLAVPNNSFETGTAWHAKYHRGFPGTAFYRATWGTATPRSGNYGYTISNHAYGLLESEPIAVTAGGSYELSAYLGGEIDADDSYGRWVIRAGFYDSSGEHLAYKNAAWGDGSVSRWTRQGGTLQAPVGATTARIQLLLWMVGGWMAFDDVEFKAVGGSVNLAPDPSFEQDGHWQGVSNGTTSRFPGTSIWRGKWGAATPHSGTYAYAISNQAYGYLTSAPMNIVGGQQYELSTYLRGKIDREGSVLGWLLRARFYRADGSYIGFRDAARGHNGQSISTEWARKAGTVTAPADAATMRIALFLYHATGWVTFDDVAVDSDAVITKYYYFNGRRIAMRKNGVLTYLHGDHLGSTVLETDSNGNATADQKYFAYGRQRDSGPVVTDHRFTGQKQDGTGLMYYRSRYYDPAIGSFISPDTIVPDAALVSDYNRYLMVRGNPLKFSDPTGHIPETIWDAANVAMGAASLGYNVWNGNWSDAAWDAGGLVVDVGATIVPFIPGGAATALKVGRVANQATDAILATTRVSRRAVQHGDELAGLAPVSKHVLAEAMQSYRNKTFSIAGENFILNRENMERILSRHHPEYWQAAGTRQANLNTAFDGSLSINDLGELAQQVVEKGFQTRTAAADTRDLRYVAEIDGKWFEVLVAGTSDGPKRNSPGQIVHFTPLASYNP